MPRKNETPEERILAENREKAKRKIHQLLQPILEKTPQELREDEAETLRARIVYLSGDDKQKFADILRPKKKEVK